MEQTLAERFFKIRTAADDSLQTAADKVGVSRQAYMKWENGATENMKLGNLVAFCKKYKVDIKDLLSGLTPSVEDGSAASSLGATPVVYYDEKPLLTLVSAMEPDQNIQTLLSGYKVANPGLRQGMLALAREAIAAFEKRSGKED